MYFLAAAEPFTRRAFLPELARAEERFERRAPGARAVFRFLDDDAFRRLGDAVRRITFW